MMTVLECIAPNELEEGDQIAYIDGEASRSIIRHIEQCKACLQEVASLEHGAFLLTDAMFRNQCPDMDTLLLYSSSLLSQGKLKKTREHVHSCLECLKEMKVITQPFFEDKLAGFLGDVRKKFYIAMKPVPAKRPFQLAFRGNEQHESYVAGRYQILLNKLPPISMADLWQIEGQIICPEDPLTHWSGHALLTSTGEEDLQTELDEFGSFSFGNVQSSEYIFYFVLAEETIMIDHIMV